MSKECSLLAHAMGLSGAEDVFPWQQELLKRFIGGSVPSALDIPTGLGKTAVMAIWLVARACGAKLPRRLVYVVDRRAVVDQATDEAERIRRYVDETPDFQSALGLSRSLPISTLRGQHVDNREWLEDPSLPAIVIGTVDMIGSRLLFEGYRCSRKMRLYHAALLGADAFIVLDEAHLVPAFAALVRAVTEDESLKSRPSQRQFVPPSRMISLSATCRATAATFQLSDADRQHEVVTRRLDATKQLRIADPVASDALAETLASKAWDLMDGGKRVSRVIVFTDSRTTAQRAKEAIEERVTGDGGTSSSVAIETELFVGGRRVAEREQAARRLAEIGLIAGKRHKPERPVFVIATSAGEVGVDLDADHAVLDLVEWERMVQRLGRVNRRGDGQADVWIVPPALDERTQEAIEKDEKLRGMQQTSEGETEDGAEDDDDGADEKQPKRLKDDERRRVDRWRRMEATRRAISSLPCSAGVHDASPRAIAELNRAAAACIEEGSTPAPLHPELTSAVVQAWSMTSIEEHAGRPGIRPWLRGWVEDEAQTAIVWRRWLPKKSDAKAFFEAAPVETAEVLETESSLVLDWLVKRVKQVAKAHGNAADEQTIDEHGDEVSAAERAPLTGDDVVMFVLDECPRGWTLASLDILDKKGRDGLFRDIAGATIVVDVRLGGLSETGLLDAKSNRATDLSEEKTLRLPFRVREVDSIDGPGNNEGWRVEATFASRSNDDGEPVSWLAVETDPHQQSTTEDARSTRSEQRLDEHQTAVAEHARRIGEHLGLSCEYVNLLVLAAQLHDEGKKADRWQRAFGVPMDRRPLAKTTRRPRQSILAAYRHELGSLIHAEGDPRVASLSPDDRDLVLHLIAAHHGFARPILRTTGCDDAPPSALVDRARVVALRFARLERSWGPWGLAWWETLLRAADQCASRESGARGGAHG